MSENTKYEKHEKHQVMLDKHRENNHYKREAHRKGLHKLRIPAKNLK